jgi:hypothetical protein
MHHPLILTITVMRILLCLPHAHYLPFKITPTGKANICHLPEQMSLTQH